MRGEDIVLGEAGGKARIREPPEPDVERVQHHHDARDAAIGLRLLRQKIAGERKVSLTRIALGEVALAVTSAETGEIVGQRQRLAVGARDERAPTRTPRLR